MCWINDKNFGIKECVCADHTHFVQGLLLALYSKITSGLGPKGEGGELYGVLGIEPGLVEYKTSTL